MERSNGRCKSVGLEGEVLIIEHCLNDVVHGRALSNVIALQLGAAEVAVVKIFCFFSEKNIIRQRFADLKFTNFQFSALLLL